MSQPGPQIRELHVGQVVDPAIADKSHQVAQIPQIGPLGVLGLTPHGTEMPGEGLDMNHRVCLHHPTLTRLGAIGKDIAAGVLRVPLTTTGRPA